MSQINLSCFDVQIEDDDIDIFDFETFEMRLNDMLEAAQTGFLGISETQANDLRNALVEDFEEPREAWQNLLFWENQYAACESELEMGVAA